MNTVNVQVTHVIEYQYRYKINANETTQYETMQWNMNWIKPIMTIVLYVKLIRFIRIL